MPYNVDCCQNDKAKTRTTTICSMKLKHLLIVALAFLAISVEGQNIPENTQFTRIYDFIDELASEQIIEVNSLVRPYSRDKIAQWLSTAKDSIHLLNKRQRDDLFMFINDYALELDSLPQAYVHWTNKANIMNHYNRKRTYKNTETFSLSLVQPAFHARTTNGKFKFRVTPILGMDIYANKKGFITKQYYGAELQVDIANHVSIWGSIRDISLNGNRGLKSSYFPTRYQSNPTAQDSKVIGARLTQPTFLLNLPGYEYKEADYGGDYSDLRAGINFYTSWGSIGIAKDQVIWGESYRSSNIISGRAPTFPMITLKANPVRWFEINFFHAWLVSNVLDSTDFYVENEGYDSEKKHYRQRNKYMAATMLTFMPIKGLNISIGNSIIYGERNINIAYFTPFSFYKSIDHQFTKGTGTENQNSQLFFSISSRNLKHVNFYASLFADEIKFERFKKSNKESNPISYQFGMRVVNWPIKNLTVTAEYTRSHIITYKHSIANIAYTSNDYLLGHYMGDNSQEIFAEIGYKILKGLEVRAFYSMTDKGLDYDYLRTNVSTIISQKVLGERVWRQHWVGLRILYEVFNNCYAHIDLDFNSNKVTVPKSAPLDGEVRLTEQEYLDRYCPRFYQGKNFSACIGLSFGF